MNTSVAESHGGGGMACRIQEEETIYKEQCGRREREVEEVEEEELEGEE